MTTRDQAVFDAEHAKRVARKEAVNAHYRAMIYGQSPDRVAARSVMVAVAAALEVRAQLCAKLAHKAANGDLEAGKIAAQMV